MRYEATQKKKKSKATGQATTDDNKSTDKNNRSNRNKRNNKFIKEFVAKKPAELEAKFEQKLASVLAPIIAVNTMMERHLYHQYKPENVGSALSIVLMEQMLASQQLLSWTRMQIHLYLLRQCYTRCRSLCKKMGDTES